MNILKDLDKLRGTVSLNGCEMGDPLLTAQSRLVHYNSKLAKGCVYDHKIEYSVGKFGTRTNDGYVYRNPEKRLDTDHDIVAVLGYGEDGGELYFKCTHPDHNEHESCYDRSVGCSDYCRCCLGEHAKLFHSEYAGGETYLVNGLE
jgi:hypothetical protein